MFKLTYDERLGLSPPNDPETKVGRVLDVGCGTGIWAMDYGILILNAGSNYPHDTIGDEHPEAVVLGIDLSPIQPNLYVCSYLDSTRHLGVLILTISHLVYHRTYNSRSMTWKKNGLSLKSSIISTAA